MGHDHHFLSRLDRVELPHAELALSLYRDHELVRELLARSSAPKDAQRIAISLGDPETGPFVIVARDGHFITCLGDGMRTDLHVVPRRELDVIADHRTKFRQAVLRFQEGRSRPEILDRLFRHGDALMREDLAELRAVHPLIESFVMRRYLSLGEELQRATPQIVRVLKRKSRATQRTVAEYYRLCWVFSNLAIACGLGSPRLLRYMAQGESGLPVTSAALKLHLSFAGLTAAWLVARAGPEAVPPYRRRCLESTDVLERINGIVALIAIAAHNPECRAEVVATFRSALHTGVPQPFDDALGHALHTLELEAGGELSPMLQGAIRQALFGEGWPELWPGAERAEDIPLDVALPLYLVRPFAPFESSSAFAEFTALTVEVAKNEAELLCFPERLGAFARLRCRPEIAVASLRATLPAPRGPAPPRAAAPSRNEPCPCGSGKKYKRCCGPARASDGA